MLAGATVGLTALRFGEWKGSSRPMKAPSPRRAASRCISAPRPGITFSISSRDSMVPSAMPSVEVNPSWSVSTAMMSFHFVIDQ